MDDRLTFSTGNIFRRARAIVRRRIVGLSAVAFVDVFIPSLWGYLLSDAITAAVIPDVPGRPDDDVADLIRGLIALIPEAFSAAGTVLLTGIVVDAAGAEACSFRTSLLKGLVHFPINVAIAAVCVLGAVVSGILLIVPGAMVVAAWSVAIPVSTAERTRFTTAFSRSRALTKGYRWQIFGLVVFGAVAALASDIFQNEVPDWLDLDDAGFWSFGIAGAFLQLLIAMAISGGCVASYFELLWIKQGSAHAAPLAASE